MPPDDTANLARHEAEPAVVGHSVLAPVRQEIPFVFASPHSGSAYSDSFLSASRLDPIALRRSEDAFIDRLFASAVEFGAPVLCAHFPRAFVDPNREPYELDQAMFDAPLPRFCNTSSPRVASGLGTVARVVTNGEEIYRRKLRFAEVKRRIDAFYFPYHATLQGLIEATRERFGLCVLIDCHSMPSVGGPMDSDSGLRRVDSVLGDRFGTSCARALSDIAEQALSDVGFTVRRNIPYAGGYTTRRYGDPRRGVHALQIEINRALYMDEERVTPLPGFPAVETRVRGVIATLARHGADVAAS